jgi:hypothetical protein
VPATRQLASPNSATKLVRVTELTNQEFLEQYAAAGRVGLSTGTHLLDKAIARAQSRLDDRGLWGAWSHAFVFEGRRVDGHHWLVESDLDLHRKHIRFGAQENRATKYHDEKLYESLAILDFGLTEQRALALVVEALNLVADRTQYSLREILGIWLSLHKTSGRGLTNLIERDHSFFCSAFVMHLYRQVGLDLAPGLGTKAAAPDDLFRSLVPHTAYVLARGLPTSRVAELRRRIRVRLKLRARQIRAAASSLKHTATS